jgi:hypothetical protein
MMLLVLHQPGRFGEGNHRDAYTALFEVGLILAHLTEMRLARQSRQMAQKYQQEKFIDSAGEIHRLAVESLERQLREVNIFHVVP